MPQGTVLAPTLFTIYTDGCRSSFDNIPILKYADDTAIQALIKNQQDIDNYYTTINHFTSWCNDHFLKLNVKKTKELIFDFRLIDNDHEDVLCICICTLNFPILAIYQRSMVCALMSMGAWREAGL